MHLSIAYTEEDGLPECKSKMEPKSPVLLPLLSFFQREHLQVILSSSLEVAMGVPTNGQCMREEMKGEGRQELGEVERRICSRIIELNTRDEKESTFAPTSEKRGRREGRKYGEHYFMYARTTCFSHFIFCRQEVGRCLASPASFLVCSSHFFSPMLFSSAFGRKRRK